MNKTVKITFEYFRNEAIAFREIMTDASNPIEKIDRAFQALFYVYLQGTATGSDERRMDPSEIPQAQSIWEMTFAEWSMRKPYMLANLAMQAQE